MGWLVVLDFGRAEGYPPLAFYAWKALVFVNDHGGKGMLIRAEGNVNFNLVNKRLDHGWLVFYGKSLANIRVWLQKYPKTGFTFDTEKAIVYTGSYQKTAHSKTLTHNALVARHHGHGKGTLMTPGLGVAIKRTGQATGAFVKRHFVAVYISKAKPTRPPAFLVGQKTCKRASEFTNKNFPQHRGSFNLSGLSKCKLY